MSKPVTIPNAFSAQAGPISLSELDTNFNVLATAVNDFDTYGNLLTDTSGTANQINVTTPASTTISYGVGLLLQIQVANATTSATVNINVNSLGNKSLVNSDATALLPGKIALGQIILVQYDGTEFRILEGHAVSGTFTGTFTGFTSPQTTTINYYVSGGICTLTNVLFTCEGTSNSTSMSMTGLPTVCQPATGSPFVMCSGVINNSAGNYIGACLVSAGIVNFYLMTAGSNIVSSTGFSPVNIKGIVSGWSISYPLA
jgi:hypothetical protein